MRKLRRIRWPKWIGPAYTVAYCLGVIVVGCVNSRDVPWWIGDVVMPSLVIAWFGIATMRQATAEANRELWERERAERRKFSLREWN